MYYFFCMCPTQFVVVHYDSVTKKILTRSANSYCYTLADVSFADERYFFNSNAVLLDVAFSAEAVLEKSV